LRQKLHAIKGEKTNIQEQQRLTKEILENMGVGSFSINQTGEIGDNYNDLAEIYLGKKNLAGMPFADIILSNDKEVLRNYYRALQLLFSGNEIDPEVIISMLPKEVETNDRILKLDYSFVQDVYGNVLSVFVRMEDVTRERNLEEKELQEKKILSAMRSNLGGYLLMLGDAEKSLNQIESFANDTVFKDRKPDDELTSTIMKSLHSLKGLSGQFELNALKKTIHELESQIQQSGTNVIQIDTFERNLKKFKKEFNYATSLKETLGNNIINILQGVSFTQAEFKRLQESLEKGDLQAIKSLILEKTLSPASKIVENWDTDIEKLAGELGKKINFQVDVPEDLQVPNEVAQKLNAELGHIYRNCIDHGIESAEDRLKQGKEDTGNIRVMILKDAGFLRVEIQDDGAGLDQEKIIKIAQSNPDLDQEEINKYCAAGDVWKILFLPGFSSSKTVTMVSGRGIGLDAVKDAIQSIKGSITVTSRLNEGTAFIIKIQVIPD